MANPGLQDVQSRVRIPLVNIQEAYSSAITGLSNIPGSIIGSEQHYMNCFPQKGSNPTTGETEYSLPKRPGISYASLNFTSILDLNTHSCSILANIAITQCADVNIAAVFEATANKIHIVQYRYSAGTVTKIGSITAGVSNLDQIYLTELELTSSRKAGVGVIWINAAGTASHGYWAITTANVFTAASLTQIVSANFPDQKGTPEMLRGPMQQLNGTIYVMNEFGDICNSNAVYDVVAWSSAVINTYMYPDNGVGIFRFKHHIVGFSDTTIEFFNDVGRALPASPLERTEQAFIKFGGHTALAIKNVDDTLYWLAASDSSTVGLWKLEGYTPVKLSTPREDVWIAQAISGGTTTVRIDSILIHGQKHVLLNGVRNYLNSLDTMGFTKDAADPYTYDSALEFRPFCLAYCIESNAWWGIKDNSSESLSTSFLVAPHYTSIFGDKYVQLILKTDAIGGDTLAAASIYFIDSGSGFPPTQDQTLTGGTNTTTPVTVAIQTAGLDFNTTKRKFIKKVNIVTTTIGKANGDTDVPYIYLICDKKYGAGAPTQSAPGNYLVRNIPVPTNYNARYYGNNFGAVRRMAWLLVYKSKTNFQPSYLELEVIQGNA